MSEIAPGIRLSFDDYDKANKVGMRVRQMNKDEMSKEYFSLKNVGLGITCILPVVLSLDSFQKKYKNLWLDDSLDVINVGEDILIHAEDIFANLIFCDTAKRQLK